MGGTESNDELTVIISQLQEGHRHVQTFVRASMNLQIAVCLKRCMRVAMCVQMLIYTACL